MEPFGQAIKEHLELKERNSVLEQEMPLASYRGEQVLANHAMFRSEADAQQEENSSDTAEADWPRAEADMGLHSPEELWVAEPVFNWGD
jgi:hypothetical protein